MLFALDGRRKYVKPLRLQEVMDGNVDQIGKLNHSLDANIVHRAFDLGNMRLRNARLFLNIALAEASIFSGSAEISREIIALHLAFNWLVAFVVSARWCRILRGDCCGFCATRSVKTDFWSLRDGGACLQGRLGSRPRTLPATGYRS